MKKVERTYEKNKLKTEERETKSREVLDKYVIINLLSYP